MSDAPGWDDKDSWFFGLVYAALPGTILFWSFVLRTFLKIGNRPRYNSPPPNELSFGIHQALVYGGLVLQLASMVLVPILILALATRRQFKRNYTPHLLAWLVLMALFIVGFREFGDWFSD